MLERKGLPAPKGAPDSASQSAGGVGGGLSSPADPISSAKRDGLDGWLDSSSSQKGQAGDLSTYQPLLDTLSRYGIRLLSPEGRRALAENLFEQGVTEETLGAFCDHIEQQADPGQAPAITAKFLDSGQVTEIAAEMGAYAREKEAREAARRGYVGGLDCGERIQQADMIRSQQRSQAMDDAGWPYDVPGAR